MFRVSVKNEATQYLAQAAPDYAKRAINYALASTGKFLRERVKAQGIMGSHGGYLGWRPLSPFTGTLNRRHGRGGAIRTIRNTRGRGKGKYRFGSSNPAMGKGYNPLNLSTRTEPMSRLVGAVRSKVNNAGMEVRVGFLEPRLWKMMEKQAVGFSTPVTRRMRKMYFAMGLAIPKTKRTITSPKRNWIATVAEREQANAAAHFEQRFLYGFQQLNSGAGGIASPGSATASR